MTPWVAEVTVSFLPPSLQASECVGKVFDIDLKADVNEIERVGQLEDPLNVTKTLSIRVVAKGECSSAPTSDAELKKRLRLTTSKQEVYLGSFEVTDNAVNQAMMQLRETASSAESEKGAKDILADYYEEVEKRKLGLIDEQGRQFEGLALRAAPLGLDLGPSLELWQLPKELLGAAEAMPDDVEALKKLVAELRNQLDAASKQNDKAQKTIVQLQAALEDANKKPMQRAKSSKKAVAQAPPMQTEQPKSSACTIA